MKPLARPRERRDKHAAPRDPMPRWSCGCCGQSGTVEHPEQSDTLARLAAAYHAHQRDAHDGQ